MNVRKISIRTVGKSGQEFQIIPKPGVTFTADGKCPAISWFSFNAEGEMIITFDEDVKFTQDQKDPQHQWIMSNFL